MLFSHQSRPVIVKLLFSLTLFLISCRLGEDYQRPALETVSNQYDQSVKEPDQGDINHFWQRIADPLLNQYVEQLLVDNLSLKQAASRVVQASTQITTARSALIPNLTSNVSLRRSFEPSNNFAIASDNNQRLYNTNYEFSLSSAWQIDLFGRLRRQIEARQANFAASHYDYLALQQSLIAELSKLRVAMAVNQRYLAIADERALNQE